MTVPLLFLDVDGVLNPFAVRPGVVPRGYVEHAIQGYVVLLTPRHGEWLTSLLDRFDVVWATTWEDDANDEIGFRIGLPRLPWITFGDVERRGAWKVPAIDRFAAGRPLAWIDDQLDADAEAWAREREAPTLLLHSNPGVGLIRRHIKTLERFAYRLGRGVAPV